MAAVADAAAHEEGAECGLRKHAGSEVVGEFALVDRAIHFCDFVGADGINLLAEKGRDRGDLVHVAAAEQIVLVAEELVDAVSAKPRRSTEEKLRHAGVAGASGAAAFAT